MGENNPQEFADKVLWEGGIIGYLEYAGDNPTLWPPELLPLAKEALRVLNNFDESFRAWAEENGVDLDE